jgi:hypothetical protein
MTGSLVQIHDALPLRPLCRQLGRLEFLLDLRPLPNFSFKT